jgi:ADP-ribosylglycohydrolase
MSENPTNHEQRLALARQSLHGLTLGDQFGECYFVNRSDEELRDMIAKKFTPPIEWIFTDDTVMGIAVYETLRLKHTIDPDVLAGLFVKYWQLQPDRGYGAGARQLLREISEGGSWRELAPAMFEGQGSFGNGAAMRAGPIGAYFYDNLQRVVEKASRSADITHANEEGRAGAIAVAVAAALATRQRLGLNVFTPEAFLDIIIAHTPDTDTCSRISKAKSIPADYRIETVIHALGNGVKVSAPDTVPICLWCAAHNLNDFEAAQWRIVEALGDRDTTCAIVGSIVGLSAPEETIPKNWNDALERMENSPFIS